MAACAPSLPAVPGGSALMAVGLRRCGGGHAKKRKETTTHEGGGGVGGDARVREELE